MSTTEKSGLLKYKDKAGNLYIMFPITNVENINGLAEFVEKAVWNAGVLPSVSASDNGKFLRVVNGAWAAVSISNANGVSF